MPVPWAQLAGDIINGTTTTNQTTPVQVEGVGGSGYLTGIASVSVDYQTTCAVTTGGTNAYCWGAGGYGQLGNNTTTTSQTTPVAVMRGF